MSYKETAKSSFSWSILMQLATQAINFIVSVILARLLFPADFGVIGIVAIFMNVGRTLLDGGLASSLIRSIEVDDEDYSTVFFINLIASFSLYAIIFVFSPIIADFFNQESLVLLLRIYGVVILIGGFSMVQSVRLNKNLQFKTQFILQIPSLIISAIVGIWMAINGYGVWSLVYKEIVFTLLGTLLLWYYSKWKPSLSLNTLKLKTHWRYAWKILITEILSIVFNDLYKVFIGKIFSIHQLGLFTRARSLQELPSNIIFNAINRVMFPLLSSIQEDENNLKIVYRQIVSSVSYFVIPLLSLMAILAEPLIELLLTDKWLEMIPFFQVLIIAGLVSPLQSYLINICKVKGRSDLVLKISFFEYSLIILLIIPSIWFGILWLLWSIVFVSFIKTFVTGIIAGKLIKYTLKEQLGDLFQTLLLTIVSSIVSCGALLILNIKNDLNLIIELIIPSMVFAIIYFGVSYLISNQIFVQFKSYVRQRFT